MKKAASYIRRLRRNLVMRLVVLVFVTGLASLLGLLVLFFILRHAAFGSLAPGWAAHFVPPGVGLLVFIGVPLFIIWVASRLVTRPLKKFNVAIQALQAKDYKVQLRPAGITEFDRVFTSFNELIARLRTEEELRKDLISDTSHELNTPLAGLIGQLTAMQEGTLPTDKPRIAILKDQADRLEQLVSQLDAYTRARLPASAAREPLNLRHICQQALHEVEPLLHEKHMAVELGVAQDITVDGDRQALRQILANILQNALRYSEATLITITADGHGLTIADNGKGVADDARLHLFERFYRVDKSRSRESGGLGLGLAITQELVRQQGWHITAKDARPGLKVVITFGP